MVNAGRKQFIWLACLCLCLFVSVSGGGCAVGTTRLDVRHEALDEVQKREGTILVKRVVDERDSEQRPYIGNKRNMYGMVLGHVAVNKGEQIEDIMTEYIVEALEQAGYTPIIEKSIPDAATDLSGHGVTLRCTLQTFWLDMYMAVWHKIGIKAELLDKNDKILWTNQVNTGQSDTLTWGTSSEIEKFISQALTEWLNQAVIEFASDDFYQNVQKGHDQLE